uniref:Integrase catalytic domain-containing protein n=1 Tax=Globodera pallida TaxID=36090 RepID=A0A183C7L2_GLOPA
MVPLTTALSKLLNCKAENLAEYLNNPEAVNKASVYLSGKTLKTTYLNQLLAIEESGEESDKSTEDHNYLDYLNFRTWQTPEFPEIEFNVNTMGLTVYCPRHLKTPRLVPWDQPGRCSRCRSATVELDYFIQAEGVTVFSTRLKNGGENFVPFDEIVDFGDNAKFRIRSRNKVFTLPLRHPEIPELERQGIIVHAGPPSDEMLNKLPKPFLIVYDDLMGEIDAKKLADLYTKKSHHNNFAVMFLTQNLFDKAMRVPRSNAQYIFLMRAPNDMLSIRNLATQIFPREQGFLIDAYKQACAEPYGRAGCEELLTLVEICLNILNGSFCLTNKQKQKIAPFANFIRKLARARSEKKKMTNKLILLPIEHYRGLVAARENREDGVTEQTNFGFVKQQLEKAKRKRAANVSEKSAMYNQQLRRYLKLRKEAKDKPVKVQLSNGLRLMTKPPATGVQLKPGPEELEETIVIGGSLSRSFRSFSTRYPKRFGVNERDKVINPSTGREFIDFDLAWAIERLVNPRPENAPSPSGTRELTKKLLQDPTAKQLINPVFFGSGKIKKEHPGVKRAEFDEFLRGSTTYTLFKPKREKFRRLRTIPGGFMTDVQADLADFQALSRKNLGNRYLLLAVDVLSRRMFGVPVKSKKPADMKKAFEELFGQMPKLPETLYTDRGLEFVAKPLKEFYAEKGIKKVEKKYKERMRDGEKEMLVKFIGFPEKYWITNEDFVE